MIEIKTFEKHLLALELLRRHALIAIIHEVTDIPIKVLRATYKKMHGHSSQRGKPKNSTRGLTRTIKAYKEATLFAVYFKTVNSEISESQIQKVIIAFDAYKELFPTSRLDFSAAWVIAREMQNEIISLMKCTCGAAILINAREDLNDRCEICKTSI